jgi:O-antigen/teichoic acid export membrane protein
MRKILTSSAIKSIYICVSFGVTLLITNLLPVYEFGIYSMAIAAGNLAAIPSRVGFPQLSVREISYINHSQNPHGAKSYLKWAYTRSVKLAIASTLVTMVLFALLTDDASKLLTYFFVLAAIPLLSIGAISDGAIRGFGNIYTGQLNEAVVRPFSMLIFVSLCYFALAEFPARQTANFVAVGYLSAGVIGLVFSWIFLRKLLRKFDIENNKAISKETQSIRQKEIVRWKKSILALSAVGAGYIVMQNADVLMLGALASENAAAIYRVQIQVSNVAALVLQACAIAFAPRIASLYRQGNISDSKRLLRRSALLSCGFSVCFSALVLIFWERGIGSLFGSAYENLGPGLWILLAAQIVNASFGVVTVVLNMCEKEGLAIRAIGLALVANVLLNIVLIPAFGGIGAAFATLISMTLLNLHMWTSIRKSFGLNSSILG